jgi:hypothetical protein
MRRPLVAVGIAAALAAVIVLSAFVSVASTTPSPRPGAPERAPVVLASNDSHVSTLGTNYCLYASIAAGGLTGLEIGSFAGPEGSLVGAGVGAVVGGVAGYIGGYYGCSQSTNAASTDFWHTWANTVAGAFGNEVNASSNKYQALLTTLNVSEVGWQRAADHAALAQLGNSSFNVSLDLQDSEVLGNLSPIYSAYSEEVASAVAAVFTQVNGYGGAGAVFASDDPSITYNSPLAATANTVASIMGYGAGFGAATSEVNVWIPHGAVLNAASGRTIDIHNEQDAKASGWYNWTVAQVGSTGFGAENFTGPNGEYYLTASASGGLGNLVIAGGQLTPSSATSGIANSAFFNVRDGANVVEDGYSSADTLTITGASSFTTYAYNPFPGFTAANLGKVLGGLEYEAALNGEVYWAFLRSLGYTSVGEIPANCIVPAPYLILPSSINTTFLTESEWMSLYLAFLSGMGHFYNTTLNATDFCGSTGTKQFNIGGAIWGNLAINATGYIYISNGTTPVSISGKSLPSEKFAAPSTWAVGNDTSYCFGNLTANCKGAQQLLLMPELTTVSIPVGVRWAVPAKNPIEVYAVQSGQFLTLSGNGSGVYAAGCAPLPSTGGANAGSPFCPEVTPLGTLTPGDSIYLTSCTVNGNASGNCTVTVQSVNATVTEYDCNGPCSQAAPGGGVFGGLPNPFSWLAGLFSGLCSGSGACEFAASILAGLVLIGILIAGLYVGAVELESWGQKKREGGSPPAG